MKRNFTLVIAVIALLTNSINSFSQCLTGGTFTPGATHIFETTTEGFSGNFSWSANGSGQLESSGVDVGSVKLLKTSPYFLPASSTTIAWSYNLSGTANVVSYIVEATYMVGAVENRVPVCSGGSLTTVGSEHTFAAVAPAEIIGRNFNLVISFTSTSNGSKQIVVDNFKTNANNSNITLPVTINYFNAAAIAGKVQLTWLVSAESNVNRYEVERSSNGKTFTKVGAVAASLLVTYTYLDLTFSTGSNYYRLKAVDNDGKFKYSSVVLYKVGKSGIALRAYPSPATTEVTIQHDAATDASIINIQSVSGQVIKTVKPATGNVETKLSISLLKTGLYLVSYTNSNGETETMKLIKQ